MSALLWVDAAAGASGDMLLGALLDAGAPLDAVQAAVDAIGVEQVRVRTRRVHRHGLAATAVDVTAAEVSATRTWRDIRALLEAAALPDPVRRRALDTFARLGRAEAAVHGVTPAEVHFHEVGALDAIADIVGVSAALHSLGAADTTTVHAGPVTVGSGRARGAHGVVPVPAPAVLALLAEAGAPVQGGPAPYEMCTPTGAALLAATVTAWGPLPPMVVRAVGVGAGSRDLDEVPNVLRVVLGEPAPGPGSGAPAATTALVIEANVDDLDPRLWPPVLARLLDAGAADAWLTPITMKKGRPAHTLGVLVAPERAEAIRRVVFTETSTIGLRETTVAKRALARAEHVVDVAGEAVRVKIASLGGVVVNASPEYDDVAAAAAALGRPVKAVLAEAVAAAHAAGHAAGHGARPAPGRAP